MSTHIAVVASGAPVAATEAASAGAPLPAEASFASALGQQLTALLGAAPADPAAEAAGEEAAAGGGATAPAAEGALALPWPLQSLTPLTPAQAGAPGARAADSFAGATDPDAIQSGRTPRPLADTLIAAQAAPGEDARGRFPLLHATSDREGALPAPSGDVAPAAAPQLPAAAPPATPAPQTLTLDVPVRAPEWREAFGDRVVLLAREQVQSAELHVTPPELGPVSVRIDVDGAEANIVFGVQHPDTRNAIADALPRLAEMLAAQGLSLGGAQVGAELARDRNPAEAERGRRGGGDDAAPGIAPTPAAVRRGLVDLFA